MARGAAPPVGSPWLLLVVAMTGLALILAGLYTFTRGGASSTELVEEGGAEALRQPRRARTTPPA